jgi:hypothetical protein
MTVYDLSADYVVSTNATVEIALSPRLALLRPP